MPRSSKPQPATPTGPRLVKATPKKLSQPDVTHAQIAIRAYELFEQQGYMHGNDLEHWLKEERELKDVASGPPPRRVAGTRARS
jgi:Protein of unknown function (DUF2934)